MLVDDYVWLNIYLNIIIFVDLCSSHELHKSIHIGSNTDYRWLHAFPNESLKTTPEQEIAQSLRSIQMWFDPLVIISEQVCWTRKGSSIEMQFPHFT